MPDDIDRSNWSAQDHEAERQAQDLASLVTGPPPPPPPDRPATRWLERVRDRWGLQGQKLTFVLVLVALAVLAALLLVFFLLSGEERDPFTFQPQATTSSLATTSVAPTTGSTAGVVSTGGSSMPAVSPAAGTYLLDVDSASDALSQVVTEFTSARGSITVGPDGTVTGGLTYWYDDLMGQDVIASVVFDGLLASVSLVAVDDGYTFTTTMAVTLDVTPHGTGGDVPPPYVADTSFEVLGVLDLELRTIALAQVDDDAQGVVIFRG